MNINYDEIITKANARKEALQHFAQQVDALGELVDDVNALQQRMASLRTACKALDAEAVTMVGQYKVTALVELADCYGNFINAMSYTAGFKPPINKVLQELLPRT